MILEIYIDFNFEKFLNFFGPNLGFNHVATDTNTEEDGWKLKNFYIDLTLKKIVVLRRGHFKILKRLSPSLSAEF
jgi:hypothetical protein